MTQSNKILLPEAHRLRVAYDVMHALAHPLRLQILAIIHRHTTASVQMLFSELGREQSVVSQHLRLLRQCKLVSTERRGKFVYYRIDEQRIETLVHYAAQLAGENSEKERQPE